jgi:hypothetical protein
MNEPRRLLDDNPTGLERDLLTAGASYRSSDEARQKTLTALGLVGTAAVSAGVAAASTSALEKMSLFKLLTLSGVGVAALTPIGFYAYQKLEGPGEKPVPAVVATTAPPARLAERPAPAPVLPSEVIEAPGVEAPKADARSTSGALSAELGVLDMARSKLADGDARGALGVLDEYAKTYPRGRLGLEAEVLRIDALARAGETGAAKKRAEAFVKRYPKSVLAPRVRRYLDEPR